MTLQESTSTLDPQGGGSGILTCVRPCVTCSTPAHFSKRSKGRYCADCRSLRRAEATAQNKRKYHWTPDQDDILRAKYNDKRGTVAALMRSLPYDRAAIVNRAAQLGLGRPRKEPRWTREELDFLEAHAGAWTNDRMSRHLNRTRIAIRSKLLQLSISSAVREGYTRESLADCFGVSIPMADKWIRCRFITGGRRYDKDAGPHHFTDEDVLKFIREHPTAFRLDKVDQTWFIDLVLGIRIDAREAA